MNNFEIYILEVIDLKKKKQYDLAWRKANEYMLKLVQEGHEMWYMLYHQMADILAREKKWYEALKQMTYTFHYLGKVGGITHQRFIEKLLKKVDKSSYFDEFVKISIDPELDIETKISLTTEFRSLSA
ncbi:hypothetical protein [Autumnicola psychrophila]|uniref:DUF309 domain-containing protein n=1 Tax=Autumnicola psychrophila TaxID=3075592 RepID=A0ABU3DPY8_9FLAO|nr:hypothetical protein [Zunongwangia sp. F225]MDT0685589.1 hypothetical protein [Zunongwangia sp. F225]